jgi:hypothetical protein
VASRPLGWGLAVMTVLRARRRTGGSAVWLGGVVLLLGLSGCGDALETYRSAVGINKNDPDPANAPFQGNLDKAETGSYPNLASVPAPPEIATTVAERQQLTASLTGTRSSVEANGGTPTPGPVPPPPAIPPGLQAPETSTSAQPTPLPSTPLPPSRPTSEPPPPLPQNTVMQTPTLNNPPNFGASRPAPAQEPPSAMPRPGSFQPSPTTLASGDPTPAPPMASLPPAKPSPEVAALPPPKLPPVPVTVASFDIAPGSTALPADARPHLADVVKQYQQQPRIVRVVSYTAPTTGGAEQLNAFRGALDRAQIIASELIDAGIPKDKVQTEASPSGANTPPGRVEIQLMQ